MFMFQTHGAVSTMRKKVIKLGFVNIHDYVCDKFNKEAEALKLSLRATPSINSAKPKRVKKRK